MSSDSSPVPADRFLERLQQARDGSREALGKLLEAFRHYLRECAREQLGSNRDGGDNSSDVVQETMAHALRAFPQFNGHTKAEFQSWLHRILLNAANDCHRARQRRHTELVDPTAPSSPLTLSELFEPSPAESAMATEEHWIVQASFDQLPERYQKVIHLYYFEQFSLTDIAERLALSYDAAFKLLRRAIGALRQLVKDGGLE